MPTASGGTAVDAPTQQMTTLELPPQVTAQDTEISAPTRPWRRTLTIEQAAYITLFALALLTHLWGLGDRALHHDETHHANFSWQLYMGHGYTHDPLLHGPFLYHLGALIFFLFGDTNTTARLGVALFGSLLVALPYLIRRELGRGAALLASIYLLISPAFLYVGRFIRHDMYAVTFELLTFIGIVRYASTRQARWLYLCAAALGLMFTTMETFFLYVAIFAPLLVLVFLWRVWKPGIVLAGVLGVALVALVFVLPGQARQDGGGIERANGPFVCPSVSNPSPPNNPIVYDPGPLLGLGPLATADNNYALCVRNQPDNRLDIYFIKLGQFLLHPAIVLALVLLTGGGALLGWLIWRRHGADRLTAWQQARTSTDGMLDAFASLASGRRILAALAIFFSIYALLFSAFLSNIAGIVTGATGSVLYWLGQHAVQRGSQPRYYYLVLMAIYEPLALLWSLIGLGMVAWFGSRYLLRRSRLPDGIPQRDTSSIHWNLALPLMLAWWSIATFALYSWAGEKMPWLTIHVALPPVLLGAWALARTLRWGLGRLLDQHSARAPATQNGFNSNGSGAPYARSLWRALLLYLLAFSAVTTFCFVLLSIVTNPSNGQYDAVRWVPPLGLAILAAVTVCYGLLRGWRETVGALALAVTIMTSLYTLRSSYQLNYRWGDVPREMMIFVQTSPDVARVLDRLEQASIRRTSGLDMPVWYDNETIWSWYLRRFTKGQQQQPALNTVPGPEVEAVLMLQENIDSYPRNLQNLQGFRIQRYPLRWWFPEEATYRLPPDWRTAPLTPNASLLMRLLRTPFDGQTIAQTWQFLIYRQLPAPLGSTDFVLAVRPDLADEIGLGTGADIK